MTGAEEVSLPTQAKIFLGDAEPVVRPAENPQTLDRVGGVRDQDAIALCRTPPDPPSQLMKLGQAEPFRVLDHHHRSVRYIDPHLDHSGGDEYVDLACSEGAHHAILFVGGLLAMEERQAMLGEDVAAQRLVLFRRCSQLHRLRTLDERVDDERLPPLVDLTAHEIENLRPISASPEPRLHGCATRRALVEKRKIEIAVKGECEGARNGRRRHHQHIRVEAFASVRHLSPRG